MTIKKRIAELPPTVDWSRLPLMLSEAEAAGTLGVSLSYLRKSRCEGVRKKRTPPPPFVRVDGRCYYRIADLRAWVDGLVSQQVVGEGVADHGRQICGHSKGIIRK